jgi:hypothetical protein
VSIQGTLVTLCQILCPALGRPGAGQLAHTAGFGLLHLGKCIGKVPKAHSITDGAGRWSLNTIGAIVCSQSPSGALLASSLSKNIFGHWDVQSDELAFQASCAYQHLPAWSSHTLWPEQISHRSAAAKEQPVRQDFYPLAICVTRIGFVLVTDVAGHRVWKMQQSNICEMKVLAGSVALKVVTEEQLMAIAS